jgi:hypothetical protein
LSIAIKFPISSKNQNAKFFPHIIVCDYWENIWGRVFAGIFGIFKEAKCLHFQPKSIIIINDTKPIGSQQGLDSDCAFSDNSDTLSEFHIYGGSKNAISCPICLLWILPNLVADCD